MGLLEDIHEKLVSVEASLFALHAKLEGKPAADKSTPAKPPADKKAAASKSVAKTEAPPELEEETDPFAIEEEAELTPEEVANNCKKLMDGVTDKKGFRSGFVELLNKQFGVDNVAKVPVEKLGQLMAAVEKLAASVK
jgi:hypothetical protein